MLTTLIVLASVVGFLLFLVGYSILLGWLIDDAPLLRAWWRFQDRRREATWQRRNWDRLVQLCREAAEETGSPASFWLSEDGRELSVTPDAHIYEAQIVIKKRDWAKYTGREKGYISMGIEMSVRENRPVVW